MQVRFNCPNDTCVAIIEYEPLEECGDSMECPRCHQSHAMTITDAPRQRNIIERCAVCGADSMFVRKDFPQWLGLMIVVAFGLLAVYFFKVSLVKAWITLIVGALLDLAIYLSVGKVTACYACRAEYRKCAINPAHEGYDLATAEKY